MNASLNMLSTVSTEERFMDRALRQAMEFAPEASSEVWEQIRQAIFAAAEMVGEEAQSRYQAKYARHLLELES